MANGQTIVISAFLLLNANLEKIFLINAPCGGYTSYVGVADTFPSKGKACRAPTRSLVNRPLNSN